MIGPVAYLGGKRRLAPRLIPLFPEHQTYVEPFAGGAQVFFHKEPSPVEVLNDLELDVVNFFRVVQNHHEELLRYLRFAIVSRKMYEFFQAQNPAALTDVQRAARFLYLQKNSFGGKIHGQHYHISVSKRPNYNLERLPELLENTAERLRLTQIENLPASEVIQRYDRPATFFYCDPPYVGVDFYHHNLADEDFSQLAEQLAGITGKFLLSINDHPVAREAFGRFQMREVMVPYTVSRKVPAVRELVFANYDLPPEEALLDSKAS